mgnify:CR=1 FL=1|jgi:hypothetical protein
MNLEGHIKTPFLPEGETLSGRKGALYEYTFIIF